MHEFDKYIGSIISSLRISKKKKDELAQEFADHLEMLKQDFIKEGLTAENAVKEAIRSFGNNKELKVKLSESIHNYKTLPNILFGICFTLFLFKVGSHIPIPAYSTYTKFSLILFLMPSIILFIPVGYFLPVIFKSVSKIQNVAWVSLMLSTTLGIIHSITLSPIQTWLIVATVFGRLLGSMLGFMILDTISKIVYKYRLKGVAF